MHKVPSFSLVVKAECKHHLHGMQMHANSEAGSLTVRLLCLTPHPWGVCVEICTQMWGCRTVPGSGRVGVTSQPQKGRAACSGRLHFAGACQPEGCQH